MSKRFWRTCRTELQLNNCGFDHDLVDSIVRSQWQSKSKSSLYLVYRWLVAIFLVSVVVYSLVFHAQKADIGFFFIYLTNWGVMLNMIVGVMGAMLVTIWHFHRDFEEIVLENDQMPIAFKIYWALHNVALITSFVITLIYWTLLHSEKIGLGALNILSHACNSIIMFLDLLIVAYPMRLYHVIHPIAFVFTYALFSLIYFFCDGKNILGQPYIYHILDWSQPGKTLLLGVGVLILIIFIHFALFWIYKLRVFIHRRFFDTRWKSSEIAGYTNEIYATSSSIVFK